MITFVPPDYGKEYFKTVSEKDISISIAEYGLDVHIKDITVPVPEFMMDFLAENRQAVEKINALSPNDSRARQWRDDLLYLEGQERQTGVRETRAANEVESLADTKRSATQPGEMVGGPETYLRYTEAGRPRSANLPVAAYPAQDMVATVPNYGATAPQFNVRTQGFATPGQTDMWRSVPSQAPEAEEVTEARQNLDKARKAVQEQAAKLERVQLNVEDIAQNAEDEKKLSEFIGANYGWALQGQPQAVAGLSGANQFAGTVGAVDLSNNVQGRGTLSGNVTAGTTVHTISRRNADTGATWDPNGFNQGFGNVANAGDIQNGTHANAIWADGRNWTYNAGGTTVSGGNLEMFTNLGTGVTLAGGTLAGSGGLGAGTVVLSGTNGYTGATTVNNGTLRVQNGASLTGTSGVQVNGTAGVDFTTGGWTLGGGHGQVTGGTVSLGGAEPGYQRPGHGRPAIRSGERCPRRECFARHVHTGRPDGRHHGGVLRGPDRL